ncbi:HypC/HybG/HupF family hydrogenase formation chaperone [Methylocystis sp. WRRC1]|uniref:HypC/HybG/HupF family hydrogenase formation chaperone n=1 Tax=Methylocystis sp. WRRC1 TaxID=1732014 RepID=UPI001D13FCC1|nr:HypC/HybG/HupF family hydrogenase formation chaperone [Methylocystis sp. WRRC1]MCC3245417.1 HypC/HybG/HupF family hydrogenase formation chaperone [Methylocystis sp. WRRC1]
MCLAIPAQVTELLGEYMARIDMGGVSKEINVALIDDLKVGDFVVVHVGHALSKLDQAEAERTLDLLREAMAAMENTL